jgi:hypothetical protein
MILKLQQTPIGSLTQSAAAEYVGGLEPLRELEDQWGLAAWSEKKTIKRYRVSAIDEAMKRAEEANFLRSRERKPESLNP